MPTDELQTTMSFIGPEDPILSEVEKKELAIRRMLASRDRRREILRRAKKARQLSHNPKKGWRRYGVPHMVTADTVNEAIGNVEPEKAKSRYRTRNNINGAIFKVRPAGKDKFVPLGRFISKRKNSHGNELKAWCLSEYYHIAKPAFEREKANGNL